MEEQLSKIQSLTELLDMLEKKDLISETELKMIVNFSYSLGFKDMAEDIAEFFIDSLQHVRNPKEKCSNPFNTHFSQN